MNVNLTPDAIQAFNEIQSSPLCASMIEDAEDFIIENFDNESLSKQALDCIRGLRIIRRLLEKIYVKDEQ